MTCCTGATRCVGCEVDGIPIAGADWLGDQWLAQMAPSRLGTARPAVHTIRTAHTSPVGPSKPPQRVVARSDGRRNVVARGNPPVVPGTEVILVDRPQRLFDRRSRRQKA